MFRPVRQRGDCARQTLKGTAFFWHGGRAGSSHLCNIAAVHLQDFPQKSVASNETRRDNHTVRYQHRAYSRLSSNVALLQALLCCTSRARRAKGAQRSRSTESEKQHKLQKGYTCFLGAPSRGILVQSDAATTVET